MEKDKQLDMQLDLLTDLPASEVMNLRRHLDEAIIDPTYTIVVNYPIKCVVRVAEHYGMDISNVEIHSFPNTSIAELIQFKEALDGLKKEEE
jgi:hypothetical protein